MTSAMNCDEAEVLMHALIDGELDAGHAREVEAHVEGCAGCTARLREFRELRAAMAPAAMRFMAPAGLRARIEGKLPVPQAVTSRRSVIKGFAAGAGLSAIAASGLLLMVMRTDDQKRILGEVVSAHLRSLQAQHLIDVQSSDQHTVKPWFNGRLDVAPPVVDLTAQGFTLLGGRLDTLDAKPVAVIVYRRRVHIINLFCAPAPGSAHRAASMASLHGFNVRRWSENGINLWAVSDLNAEELAEFGEKFEAALKQ
jgi:anti-sigma factor RsiW